MAILFDIGKTNMRVAYSADGKEFDKPLVAPTPEDFDEAVRVFCEMARGASMGRPIDVLSGGLPGTLNPDGTGLLHAPTPIQNWKGMPFAERLEKELGGRVLLSNDAILVALGEAHHGAGKGHDVVGYLTFSTGVGGARVSGGKVDRTAYGFEPGKLVLPHMGDHMTVEDFAAGSGLKARYHKEPFDIREEQVWIEAAQAAGYLVHASTLLWSPQILIVGGPMVLGDPAISFDQIEMEAKRLLGERANELTLVKATLKGFGGLWGALAVYQAHSAN